MEDEEGQDHVAIEMDNLDDQPFAERAAVRIAPREGTRQHRIAPEQPVGVLDGRQVRRYAIYDPHRYGRADARARRAFEEEESEDENVITEARREWYRLRETRGVEDRRSPMSTESKWLLIFWFALVIIIIIIITSYVLSGKYEDNGNLTISYPLDDFRVLLDEAVE